MLSKVAYLFDDQDARQNSNRVGFLQVRLVGPQKPKAARKAKVQKKKGGDKNLRCSDTSPEIQRGLRKSRVVEWQKWKQFNAGVVLSKKEVDDLLAQGVTIQPMQWVETDKNAHLRRDGKFIAPDLKSRLVGCGNFEETDGIRTDSPAGDVDSHNLIFSWCASHKVMIRSADISNAYLQGNEVDRIILYRIPKGGIPEEGIEEGTIIAARVPIYGTKDAGRGFWLKLKEVVLSRGYKTNKILPTMFTLVKDGKIRAVMSSNVDDLLYGSRPGFDAEIRENLDEFQVKQILDTEFRFCGKEVKQLEDMSILVTAKDNTEKVRPIEVGKKKLVEKCNSVENTALRSVVASLAWIARQVRPGLSFRVSKLQTVAGKAKIKDLRECNKVLEYALETSEEGIFYSSELGPWDDTVVTSINDASFGNEEIEVKPGEYEDGRSQQGVFVCLAPADVVNASVTTIHPISWSSTVIKRACRATLMAETMAMIKGTEAGVRIRAAIVDMRGQLDWRNWEESASSQMGHCWMTDCDSLYEHLVAPKFNQIENKRLGIDLMALRQQVWERDGERTQEVNHDCGDYPRWIDTSTMIADPLTKAMSSERLNKTMMTGKLDLVPTEESLMIKAKNRESRKKCKAIEKDKKQAVFDSEE